MGSRDALHYDDGTLMSIREEGCWMKLVLQIIYSDPYMRCDHAAFNSEILVGYSIVIRRSPDPTLCLYIHSAPSNKLAFIQTSSVSPSEVPEISGL